MKVTMQVPSITPLMTFFEYLKKVASDKIHENNVDLIADFVEKVLVVEMKRLENNTETFDQVIEIPDAVVMEPIKKAKLAFDDFFTKFLTERGSLQVTETVTPDPAPVAVAPVAVAPVASNPAPALTPFIKARAKSGNGHKIAKVRSLLGDEKDSIRSEFLKLNGQITEDACLPIHKALPSEISIFQVTGFVTYLHSLIAGGGLEVRDMKSYLDFLKGHRGLWLKYNSPKYEAMRLKALGHK